MNTFDIIGIHLLMSSKLKSGGRLFFWGFFPPRTPLLGTGRLIIFRNCPSWMFNKHPDILKFDFPAKPNSYSSANVVVIFRFYNRITVLHFKKRQNELISCLQSYRNFLKQKCPKSLKLSCSIISLMLTIITCLIS